MPARIAVITMIGAALLCVGQAAAQRFELGILAGGSGYMGELNPAGYQRYTDLAIGGLFRWNINPRNSVKFSFLHGHIQGNDARSDDAYRQSRNLHFRSPLNEFSAQFEFNFFPYNPLWGQNGFTPYVFTGISAYNFDPAAEGDPDGDGQLDWYDLQRLGTEGQGTEGYPNRYKLAQLAIPFGLGFKFNIGRNWNLNAEMGYRPTFSDFLDDVSGYYPDPVVFADNPEGAYFSDRRLRPLGEGQPMNPAGTQRGDLSKKDTYLFAVIGISYTFVSSWCPAFSDWGKE